MELLLNILFIVAAQTLTSAEQYNITQLLSALNSDRHPESLSPSVILKCLGFPALFMDP